MTQPDNPQLLSTATHADDAPADASPVKRRGGPNRLAHGLRAHRWPKGCRRAANRVNKFGHFLEARVIKRYGEIDVAAASAIDVAVRWQKHVELAQRWLAIEYDRLSPAERLHFSKEAAKGAESRDKAIRLLRLERSQEAEIDALYAELRSGALDAAPVKQTSPEPQNGGQE